MAYRILVMVGILALDAERRSVVQRDAPEPASDTGTITGVVVAADTRTPLADVAVTLRPADQLPTPRPGALVEVFKSVPAATVRTDAAGQVALVGTSSPYQCPPTTIHDARGSRDDHCGQRRIAAGETVLERSARAR